MTWDWFHVSVDSVQWSGWVSVFHRSYMPQLQLFIQTLLLYLPFVIKFTTVKAQSCQSPLYFLMLKHLALPLVKTLFYINSLNLLHNFYQGLVNQGCKYISIFSCSLENWRAGIDKIGTAAGKHASEAYQQTKAEGQTALSCHQVILRNKLIYWNITIISNCLLRIY